MLLSIFSYNIIHYMHYQFSETFLHYLSLQADINSTLQKLKPGQPLSRNCIISMAKHAVHVSLSCTTQVSENFFFKFHWLFKLLSRQKWKRILRFSKNLDFFSDFFKQKSNNRSPNFFRRCHCSFELLKKSLYCPPWIAHILNWTSFANCFPQYNNTS